MFVTTFGVTFNVALSKNLCSPITPTAVIVTLPFATEVTIPLSTVAIELSLVVQLTAVFFVTSRDVPSDSSAWAMNSCVKPIGRAAVSGVTERAVTVAVVTVIAVLSVYSVPATVIEAVTSTGDVLIFLAWIEPLLPTVLLTSSTVGSVVVQSASWVTSLTEPSVRVISAFNTVSKPTGIEVVSGVTLKL